jgi:hypothetical protein
MNAAILLNSIVTDEDVGQITEELWLLERWLGQPEPALDQVEGSVRDELYQMVAAESFLKADTRTRTAWLQGLRRRILAMEVVDIIISFKPTHRFVQRLHRQVKSTYGTDVVLRLSYDPELMGGAVINKQGTSFDMSLKRIFDARSNEQTAYIREKLSQ